MAGTAIPTLAEIVRAGEGVSAAIPITPFIHASVDVSNSYLVQTNDGNVLINAGTMRGGPRHAAAYAKIGGAIRHAVLTQSHVDHFGGLTALLEPDTVVIAQQAFPEVRAYWLGLGPFYGARTKRLWGSILGDLREEPPAEAEPDILFDDQHIFELGERRFEVLATPGGETLDSCVIWMPREGVVFTGNLFGPIFGSLPNFYTIRGDRARSIDVFLRSLDRVRALDADLMITGHGDPIVGKPAIRAALDRIDGAVRYLRDETWNGMNAGKPLHLLMREIRLPDQLSLPEQHGKIPWAIRAIWEEYAGWFHFRTTTELYDVPPASIAGDLVELVGGADRLAERARVHLDAGRPLEALHLIDIALEGAPGAIAALSVKKNALAALLARANDNLSETMWLKSCIADVESELSSTTGNTRS